MPKTSWQEQKAILDEIARQHNAAPEAVRETMRQGATEALSSRHATEEQKDAAKRCLLALRALADRVERGDIRFAILHAVDASRHYQRIRFAPLIGPAKTGGKRGTFFRGRWIEVEPQTVRLAEVLDGLGPGEHDWPAICAKAWSKPYSAKSTRYAKALADLNRAICDLDPPLLVRIYRPRQKLGPSEALIIEERPTL